MDSVREPYQDPKFPNRRWIAWKLVQLAYRIYPHSEFYQRIYVRNADGDMIWEAEIVADLYGCGISSGYGRDGELPPGSTIKLEWEYDPDWLEDLQ